MDGYVVFSVALAVLTLSLRAGLGILLLVAGFNRTANRALAITLFASVWAGVFLQILSFEEIAPNIGDRWLLYARAAWFVDSFAIFAFLANYPRPREVLPRWSRRLWPYMAVGLGFTAIQLLRPGMGFGLEGSGPLMIPDFFADTFAGLIVPLVLLHEVRAGRFERPLGPVFLAGFLPTYFVAADLMSVIWMAGVPIPTFLSSRGNLAGIGMTGEILDFLIPPRFVLGVAVLASFVWTAIRVPRVRVACGTVLAVLLGHMALRVALIPLPLNTVTFVFWDICALILGLITFTLLVYVALHDQTIGLNRKVRIGVSRAALATLFLGAFFIAAQIAQEFLADVYGLLMGGAMAGVLLFAIAPLQRAAERLAGVDRGPPDEQVAQLYREAVELTLMDRSMTAREERHLAHLAERLGLAAGQAMDIRLDVQQAMARERVAPGQDGEQ